MGRYRLAENIINVRGAAVYDETQKLVHKETNKTGSSRRTVPIMIPRLAELLSRSDKKSEYVITLSPETIQRTIDRVCERARLPVVGCHGLRHSFASLALHVGMAPDLAMRLGGWSDLATMKKYIPMYHGPILLMPRKLWPIFTSKPWPISWPKFTENNKQNVYFTIQAKIRFRKIVNHASGKIAIKQEKSHILKTIRGLFLFCIMVEAAGIEPASCFVLRPIYRCFIFPWPISWPLFYFLIFLLLPIDIGVHL